MAATMTEQGGIVRRFLPQSTGGPTVCREVRVAGKVSKIEGYAALFGVVADLRWTKEVILPGAFRESLRNKDDVRALFNHDPNLILGRTTAGTLELREDSRGLWYGVTLPDTQVARDLVVNLKNGNITGSSFAFEVLDEEPQAIDGVSVRAITRAKLYDVSPATYPAYADTTAEARGADRDYLEALRQREAEALALAVRCAGLELKGN